jgi:hypothetical protein
MKRVLRLVMPALKAPIRLKLAPLMRPFAPRVRLEPFLALKPLRIHLSVFLVWPEGIQMKLAPRLVTLAPRAPIPLRLAPLMRPFVSRVCSERTTRPTVAPIQVPVFLAQLEHLLP